MITSVAIQAYFTKMRDLLKTQGFDPDMRIIYDSGNEASTEWLSDALAEKRMARKGTTTKDTVRSTPFTCLFWTRGSLEPIVRQRYRLLDSTDDGTGIRTGKSTVSASFTMACAFISNKADAIEDLEEAFSAVFQNTYNMPLSLQYIYDSDYVKNRPINFTFIQNHGTSDLVNYKEGNLFAYSWSATIYMNYVSEFARSAVYPVSKVVVDLYAPGGFPISSLDAYGKAVTKTYTAVSGETFEVPAEPTVAFTTKNPKDYALFSITLPYAGGSPDIPPEERELIKAAILKLGGEVSLYGTSNMIGANMPLFLNHIDGEDRDADIAHTANALSDAIRTATGHEYMVAPSGI